jgi:hypothetical protein
MLIVSSDSITRCTGAASQQGDEPEPCEGSRRSRVVAWDDRKTAQPARALYLAPSPTALMHLHHCLLTG